MSEAKFIKYENLNGGSSILTDSRVIITPPHCILLTINHLFYFTSETLEAFRRLRCLRIFRESSFKTLMTLMTLKTLKFKNSKIINNIV